MQEPVRSRIIRMAVIKLDIINRMSDCRVRADKEDRLHGMICPPDDIPDRLVRPLDVHDSLPVRVGIPVSLHPEIGDHLPTGRIAVQTSAVREFDARHARPLTFERPSAQIDVSVTVERSRGEFYDSLRICINRSLNCNLISRSGANMLRLLLPTLGSIRCCNNHHSHHLGEYQENEYK